MATMANPPPCPVCSVLLTSISSRGDPIRVNCPNCGTHNFAREALEDLPGHASSALKVASLAHGIARLPTGAVVTSEMVRLLAEGTVLPPPMALIDNLVLFMGEHLPGWRNSLTPKYLAARLGCVSPESVQWVVQQAEATSLIRSDRDTYALNAKGWERHEELMRNGAGSRHAFMAMKFGDPELEAIYRNHMRPAVGGAGFDLRTTNEEHRTAGSIDNRMRVEIRTSRFVVCDLTHGNRGAYWEAGFAEGLGRPVFYTCSRDVLTNRDHADHPHFDTAHQLIIPWGRSTISEDMQELKSVIRATLPAEARMEDD